MWDVAIIGAGLTGLTCARQLRAAGLAVCVLDKSRGLGGRMATRRVSSQTHGQRNNQDYVPVRADHGLRYWQQSAVLEPLTDELIAAGVLQTWDVSAYELRQHNVLELMERQAVYVARTGMSAIAKHMASGLVPEESLLTNHRAVELSPDAGGWRIECEDRKVVMARRCAIAIPAPQAADLLEARSDDMTSLSNALSQLRSVEYNPCLTVIAGYGSQTDMGNLDPDGWMVTDTVGSSTDWVGLDSSKRDRAADTVIVIHSKPAFAERYLETGDLQPAASVLLRANARKFCDWIAQPDWFQIHQWRYAQVKKPYSGSALSVTRSLIAGGDWCSPSPGNPKNINAAYLSGLAIAEAFQRE